MEETTCLLDVGEIGSVKASVQVPVKGIKYKSLAQELVMKNCNAERSFLLDEEKVKVHKARGDLAGRQTRHIESPF